MVHMYQHNVKLELFEFTLTADLLHFFGVLRDIDSDRAGTH